MTATELYYDPYDYLIDDDPYPVWARLRDEAPLYHNEKLGFYALSRYDDVLEGLLDSETLVSSHGITMEMITPEPIGVPMMIMMDPPQHTRLRKLVSRAFTPMRAAQLEPQVRQVCADLLDPLADQKRWDLVHDFAGLLPPTMILALLGFPTDIAKEWRKEVDSAIHLEEGSTGEGDDQVRHRHREPYRRARLRGLRHAPGPHRGAPQGPEGRHALRARPRRDRRRGR